MFSGPKYPLKKGWGGKFATATKKFEFYSETAKRGLAAHAKRHETTIDDILALEDGRVVGQTRIDPGELRADPTLPARWLREQGPFDLIAGPSGYGLPLTPASDCPDAGLALMSLVRPDERGAGGVGGTSSNSSFRYMPPSASAYTSRRQKARARICNMRSGYCCHGPPLPHKHALDIVGETRRGRIAARVGIDGANAAVAERLDHGVGMFGRIRDLREEIGRAHV